MSDLDKERFGELFFLNMRTKQLLLMGFIVLMGCVAPDKSTKRSNNRPTHRQTGPSTGSDIAYVQPGKVIVQLLEPGGRERGPDFLVRLRGSKAVREEAQIGYVVAGIMEEKKTGVDGRVHFLNLIDGQVYFIEIERTRIRLQVSSAALVSELKVAVGARQLGIRQGP